MKKYEVILFDADGTLLDYDQAEAYALEKALRYFEVDYQQEHHLSHYREVNGLIWQEFEQERISVENLKVERFRRLFDRLELIWD